MMRGFALLAVAVLATGSFATAREASVTQVASSAGDSRGDEAPAPSGDLDSDAGRQTPENAHRFLSLIAEQSEIKSDPGAPRMDAVAYRVRFSKADACATRVDGEAFAYVRNNVWVKRGEKPTGGGGTGALAGLFGGAVQPQGFDPRQVERVLQANNLAGPPWVIEWNRVSSVQLRSLPTWPNRVVSVLGAGGERMLFLQDEPPAKRVQYATQFLKEYCDQTAETGF